MNLKVNFLYNSPIVLSFFFISLFALFLSEITKGKSNNQFFSTYRDSIFHPLMYVRLITHIFGHDGWSHFRNNFVMILLTGPALEEKYGSINLLIMILINAILTGIIHNLLKRNRLLGASGVSFMFILLSSFVNIEQKSIPITLILIFIFYVIDEIKDLFSRKKDHVSHMGHLIGSVCGIVFGFYFLQYNSFDHLFDLIKNLFIS